ncbi:hypothetical protein BpHYR1_054056 [Brachionus plicatilis]|uniref:Uncharacterized protein n=1 Tax=Brachionus plicatilis TaxID=10195 RepID=A0A3M7RZP3_BRAPC|nr:hypothetical protein BpHYR1_054056 [Brachionus plicatilis]
MLPLGYGGLVQANSELFRKSPKIKQNLVILSLKLLTVGACLTSSGSAFQYVMIQLVKKWSRGEHFLTSYLNLKLDMLLNKRDVNGWNRTEQNRTKFYQILWFYQNLRKFTKILNSDNFTVEEDSYFTKV